MRSIVKNYGQKSSVVPGASDERTELSLGVVPHQMGD